MEKIQSSKAIALGTTALLVICLVWLFSVKRINTSLETGLENERLKSEQLLSEKLLLDKEIQKFRDQLVSLKDQNSSLDNVVKNLNTKLNNQEAEYNRMKKQNMTLAQVKAKKAELEVLQNQLQNELTALRNSYAALASKNLELNNTVARLEERNRVLTNDLSRAMFASVDQSQIEAVKGKADKLTVRAKRTKKLIANFKVPANMKNLSFRIVDPKGHALTSQDGTTASTATPTDDSFTASADPQVMPNKLQQVQMTFLPERKLNAGLYTVEILNDNLYVSSVKVKLK